MARLIGVRTIPDAKLARYLLDENHPTGGTKARFFIARGFSPTEPGVLAAALLAHADTHPIENERSQIHGISRAVQCQLTTPDGTNPCVRVIWIQDAGQTIQRLVTAYPA